MGKRRRGASQTHYKVPSLQHLALAAVRRNNGPHFHHNRRTTSATLRRIVDMADDDMTSFHSMGTQTTSAAKEGAKQVGQGLQVTVPRNIPHGYNNNYTVRLTYSDCVNITFSGAGGSASRYFSLNSIYDPDASGGGHQPLMRDLWASQYDYYAVLSTSYHIEAYNCAYDSIGWTTVGTNNQRVSGCIATLIPTTNTLDITNAASGLPFPACEMKNTQSQALWPVGMIEWDGTLTPGDFIVDAKDSDNDNTWTAVGSNPTVQRYLGVVFNSCNSTAFSGATETPFTNIQLWFTLHYDVQFTQINQTLRAYSS